MMETPTCNNHETTTIHANTAYVHLSRRDPGWPGTGSMYSQQTQAAAASCPSAPQNPVSVINMRLKVARRIVLVRTNNED